MRICIIYVVDYTNNVQDMEDEWRIAETADYICARAYAVVAAQFPDELLKHAARVATALQAACEGRDHAVQVYVLADTSYNSLSVDEVAASHVDAECVVHYGRASLTPLSRLPAYFVFPQRQLDVQAAAVALAASSLIAGGECGAGDGAPVVVLLDQPHLSQLKELEAALRRRAGGRRLVFADVPSRNLDPETGKSTPVPPAPCCGRAAPGGGDGAGAASTQAAAPVASGCEPAVPTAGQLPPSWECGAAGYMWALDPTDEPCGFAWVGAPSAPALSQLQLTRSATPWVVFDPATGALTEGLPPEVGRTLRRRYYLVERARNAAIVGILVGTLGAAGYRAAVDGLRAAARAAGKKTYTLLMGKPSPAKLANFPEVEVFVMVADPQGQILDCRDYLAPIITPYEAMLAFTPGAEWDAAVYRLDFEDALQGRAAAGGDAEPRFSLLDGTYHEQPGEVCHVEGEGAGSALALQAQQALVVSAVPTGSSHLVQAQSAADFFVHARSWTGVEAPIVGAEAKAVERAVPGRTGRAAGYADEPR